jgi:hypothetical protein
MKLTLMILSASALVACGQDYGFTNFAGFPLAPGNADDPPGMTGFGRFSLPTDVAVDKLGNVYVADYQNSTIRQITPAGEVTTIAGKAGTTGSANGNGSVARFNNPISVAVDTNRNLYVSDRGNSTIRKIRPPTLTDTNWVVSLLAGTVGITGTNDGHPGRFQYLHGIAVDKAGIVYVADRGGHTIRKIFQQDIDIVVKTIVGAPLQFACPGVDGTNSAVRFCNDAPTGLTVDGAGILYTTDFNNSTVRKVAPIGTNWVVTTIAGYTTVDQLGNPSGGFTDGIGTNALFNQPYNLTVDSAGNLYVADTFNYTIRKITPVGTNWVVTTIGGSPGVSGSDDGAGGAALFNLPFGIGVDTNGNVYVADYQNSRITKGTPPVAPPGPPQITSIQFVSGNVQIDFTSDPADTLGMFTLQSSGTVNGTYLDVAPPATITQLGPGSFRAVVAPSGGIQFYRIKK